MKFTIKKFVLIQKALQELIAAKTPGLSYDLNLNLFRVNLIIDEWSERFKILTESFFVKGEDMKPVKVLVSREGMVIKEDGADVVYSEERKINEGQTWGFKFDPDRLSEKDDAEKLMYEETFSFNMKTLNKAKIMELDAEGKLFGVNYSALIGNLIEE